MSSALLKRGLIGILAVVCLGWCLWVLSITTRNVARGNVHLHGAKQLLIYIAGLTMFVWLTAMSVRGLRLAAGVVPLSGPRLKMWRIFVGALLLFSLAKSLLNPASNRYQSDNLAQAIGMYCASVFLFGLVVWLLRSAFPRWQRAPATND
jgi:hypothetical protein